jgi:hypothetical protein
MGQDPYIHHIHKVLTVLQGGAGEEVNEIVTYKILPCLWFKTFFVHAFGAPYLECARYAVTLTVHDTHVCK